MREFNRERNSHIFKWVQQPKMLKVKEVEEKGKKKKKQTRTWNGACGWPTVEEGPVYLRPEARSTIQAPPRPHVPGDCF